MPALVRYVLVVLGSVALLMAQHDEGISEPSTRLLRSRFAPGVGHNSISQHVAYTQWLAGLR